MRPTLSTLACRPCVNSALPTWKPLVVARRWLKLLVRSGPSVTPPKLRAPLNRLLPPAELVKKRPARAAVPPAAGVQATATVVAVNVVIAAAQTVADHHKLREKLAHGVRSKQWLNCV